MTKKALNQNAKFVQQLMDTIETDFIFGNKPIDRFNVIINNEKSANKDKTELILKLKNKISSIENCILKDNSNNLVLGDGNIDSPIMLIGEAPSKNEDNSGHTFQGETGSLLKKMLSAININIKKVYCTYSVNFRPPEDRKPTTLEIKRYSIFLKEHISIINPKIIILMGGTAMEAITGLTSKVYSERGKWKEIILKNKTYPLMVTFNPSYLIRFPENKKYSWDDLKKIRHKIEDLNIKI
jgi:DNA polymerase